MQLVPLSNYILVEPDKEGEGKTKFVVPEDFEGKGPRIGTVRACGNEVKEVQVSDKVIFSRDNIDEVEIEGVRYVILKEEDLMLKLK